MEHLTNPKPLKGLKKTNMSVSEQVSMFYNAKPHIFEKAKMLRNNMTIAKSILWEHLKGKQIQNFRFRAQHPIDIFIADFYCHPLKLVLEVDGDIHENKDQKEYDIGREAELNYLGIVVIRFTNDQILNNLPQVIAEINQICTKLKSKLQSPL